MNARTSVGRAFTSVYKRLTNEKQVDMAANGAPGSGATGKGRGAGTSIRFLAGLVLIIRLIVVVLIVDWFHGDAQIA